MAIPPANIPKLTDISSGQQWVEIPETHGLRNKGSQTAIKMFIDAITNHKIHRVLPVMKPMSVTANDVLLSAQAMLENIPATFPRRLYLGTVYISAKVEALRMTMRRHNWTAKNIYRSH
jgi:hypothetical protein